MTRTTRKRTTKTSAKNTPATKPRKPALTNREPLPVRNRPFVGPLGAHEQAAVRAAATTRLPIPVSTWNGSTAHLTDGTLLTHNPGPDRHFTAHIACRHGAIHGYPITTHTDLREARALTHACDRDHTTHADVTGLDWDKAITHTPHPAPAAKTPAVLQLREGARRAHTATAETEQPKEHPQP